jgi:hypothetical protein
MLDAGFWMLDTPTPWGRSNIDVVLQRIQHPASSIENL